MSLFGSHVPRDSIFISTQLLVQNVDGLLDGLSENLIIFLVFHYYTIILISDH